MKKILSILLLISYMLCACGVSVSFHHCAGEFKYLSVNDKDHEVKCCKGKKEMSDDCCKSNKVSFKKTDDKSQAFFSIVKKSLSDKNILNERPTLFAQVANLVPSENRRVLFRPPPHRTGTSPLYLLHSVFRI